MELGQLELITIDYLTLRSVLSHFSYSFAITCNKLYSNCYSTRLKLLYQGRDIACILHEVDGEKEREDGG